MSVKGGTYGLLAGSGWIVVPEGGDPGKLDQAASIVLPWIARAT